MIAFTQLSSIAIIYCISIQSRNLYYLNNKFFYLNIKKIRKERYYHDYLKESKKSLQFWECNIFPED